MKKLSVGNHSLRALAAAGCACVTVAAFAASDAAAISDDYCGVPKNLGDQCFQGGGYLAWRYHQASRGGLGDVPNLCAQSWTGSSYRTGSGCTGTGVSFFSFCNASSSPSGNSSINWGGTGGGPYTIYGHADDSTNHGTITNNNGC